MTNNTNLSNAHLLSDEVAHNLNAETLKQQRMEKVAQTANKPPVPENENNVIQMNPNPNNPNYQQHQQPQNQQVVNENNGEENFEGDEDAYSKYANNKSDGSDKKESKDNDNKILGMPKPLFWGGVILLVGIGGYFTWKYMKDKKSGSKSLKAPSKAVGDVAEATSEVAKSITPPPLKVA